MDTWVWVVIIVVVAGIMLAIKKPASSPAQEPVDDGNKVGYKKKPYLSQTERKFLDSIKELEQYVIIVPQVNLASVIQKTGEYKWQNELYRNTDFGIFDKDYNLLLLVELNDSTHTEPGRKKRDMKVIDICDKAGIQLMTFYTNKPNEKTFVLHRISEAINSHYF